MSSAFILSGSVFLICLLQQGLGLSDVPSRVGLSTDGPVGLSLVGSCKARASLTPAIFSQNGSLTPFRQSAEVEDDRSLQRQFQGLLTGKG